MSEPSSAASAALSLEEPVDPVGADLYPPELQGEFLTIQERVVVSPGWGRVRGEAVQADQCLETGAVFAWIVEADEALPLRAPVNGPFLAWLVMDGQRVPPGHPVALFRAVSSSDHSDFAPTSQEERP